jgi:hypothetical protein
MTMSWTIIESKLIKVTRRVIEDLRKIPPCPGDRKLTDEHTEKLRQAMRDDMFHTPKIAIAVCTATGEDYLVNGQHTLEALSALVPLPRLTLHIERCRCATLLDVADYYSTFDSPISSRRAMDIYKQRASIDPELKLLPTRLLERLVSGIALEEYGLNMFHVRVDKRAALLDTNREFVLWASGIMAREGGKLLERGPVIAIMAASWRVDKSKAEVFWAEVRDGSNTDSDSPSRRLQLFLAAKVVASSGSKVGLGRQDYYNKVLGFWNSFYGNKKPRKLRSERGRVGPRADGRKSA